MRRAALWVLIIAFAAACAFASCSAADKSTEVGAAAEAVSDAASAGAQDTDGNLLSGKTVGFVTNSGGQSDGSYYQSIDDGVTKAAEEYNFSIKYIPLSSQESQNERFSELSAVCADGAAVMVCAGNELESMVGTLQDMFPEVYFICVDFVPSSDGVEKIAKNTVSLLFREQEAGFIAGYAAARCLDEAEAGIIVADMDSKPVLRFASGFEQGIEYPNNHYETKITLPDENIIEINSYTDIAACRIAAAELYDKGANVVFPVCGGASVGAIAEAKALAANGDRTYVVGIDSDQYIEGIYGTRYSVTLTSAVKKSGSAVYDILSRIKNGSFTGGETQTLGFVDDAVGIPDENPNLLSSAQWSVELLEYQMQQGIVTVDEYTERFRP